MGVVLPLPPYLLPLPPYLLLMESSVENCSSKKDGGGEEGSEDSDAEQSGRWGPHLVTELPQPKRRPKFKGKHNYLSRVFLL